MKTTYYVQLDNKMRNQKYYTVGISPKYSRIIVETRTNTHKQDRSLSWFCICT